MNKVFYLPFKEFVLCLNDNLEYQHIYYFKKSSKHYVLQKTCLSHITKCLGIKITTIQILFCYLI